MEFPFRKRRRGLAKGLQWAGWLAAGAVAGGTVLLDRVASALLRPAPQRVERDPAGLSFPYEDVTITLDGAELRGWLITPVFEDPAAAALALVHGWTANSGTMLLLAGPLAGAGHPVLVFDVRRHGRSSASTYVTVAHFRDDAAAAAGFLAGRFPDRPRVLMGHSMGGAGVVLAAALGAPVAGIVLLAAPADVMDVTAEWLRVRHVPGVLARTLVPFLRPRVGEPLAGLAPVRKIAELDVPVLILHGEGDRRVPVRHAEALATAAGVSPVIIPGVDHHGILARKRTHREILEFLRRIETRRGTAGHPPSNRLEGSA